MTAAVSRIEQDPFDVWVWNRVVPVLLSSLSAAAVALLISWRGNKRAEDRMRVDQERSNALRRADRLKEATVAVSEVAQAWRAAIAGVQREATTHREAWARLQAEQAAIEAEIPQLRAKIAVLDGRLNSDRSQSGAVQATQVSARKQHASRIGQLERDYQSAGANAARHGDELRDLVSARLTGLRSRWIHVRGQAELMAPELTPKVSELQSALQAWEGRTAMVDRPVPVNRMQRADLAYASLLAEALCHIQRLETPSGVEETKDAEPSVNDVLMWQRDSPGELPDD